MPSGDDLGAGVEGPPTVAGDTPAARARIAEGRDTPRPRPVADPPPAPAPPPRRRRAGRVALLSLVLLGLLAAGDDQHIDINSEQDLHASYTTSDLLYLSALYDRARAAFYGVTKVRAGSRQTSSYQECRNLLLSPSAGAEPIPVLEIETNDILRCGHGATAGAIDPIQLFYAQTRGLDAASAERMIVRGFFEQVVAQIHDETIRERVLAALARRIGFAEEQAA